MDIPIYRIINGIIAFLGKGFEFTTEKSIIHNAFYKLSQDENFNFLFKNIYFIKGGNYHKSITIESIVDNMIISRLLSAKNPDLIKYQVSTGFYDIYEKNSKNYFEDQDEVIRKASNKFKEYLEA